RPTLRPQNQPFLKPKPMSSSATPHLRGRHYVLKPNPTSRSPMLPTGNPLRILKPSPSWLEVQTLHCCAECSGALIVVVPRVIADLQPRVYRIDGPLVAAFQGFDFVPGDRHR